MAGVEDKRPAGLHKPDVGAICRTKPKSVEEMVRGHDGCLTCAKKLEAPSSMRKVKKKVVPGPLWKRPLSSFWHMGGRLYTIYKRFGAKGKLSIRADNVSDAEKTGGMPLSK